MIRRLSNFFESSLVALFNRLDKPAHENRLLIGQILSQHVRTTPRVNNLSEVEFKIFSQNGEDGIIQYLISHIEFNMVNIVTISFNRFI